MQQLYGLVLPVNVRAHNEKYSTIRYRHLVNILNWSIILNEHCLFASCRPTRSGLCDLLLFEVDGNFCIKTDQVDKTL